MAGSKRQELSQKQMLLIGKALSDPRRYEILKQLRDSSAEPLPCGTMRECSEITPATLSHHMKELESAGLVEPVRVGKFVSYLQNRDVLESFLEKLRTDLT
jgi:ArsR family transcriptional regulator